jgi:hypothetical protein
MSCEVCNGTPGRYPIHNKFGKQLYEIECPECFGSGLTDEEADLEMQKRDDARRYEAAMAETRTASVGRNPEGEDPQGLRAQHEHAVPSETSADAQTPFRDGSGNATSGNPLPVKHD